MLKHCTLPADTMEPGGTVVPDVGKVLVEPLGDLLVRLAQDRRASTDEIVHWIVALADPSVTWMTGQVLSIDGGMSLT